MNQQTSSECVHYLAEGVRAISQLLQHWCFLSQVVVRVAQINLVTHHGNTQLIVEPADRRRGAKEKGRVI